MNDKLTLCPECGCPEYWNIAALRAELEAARAKVSKYHHAYVVMAEANDQNLAKIAEMKGTIDAASKWIDNAMGSFDTLNARIAELVEQVDTTYAPYREMVRVARAETDKYSTGLYLANEKITALEAEKKATCAWKEDSESCWNTSCGEAYQFEFETPAANGVAFCHHCGKQTVFTSYVEPEEEE